MADRVADEGRSAQFDAADLERRLRLSAIAPDDLSRLAAIKGAVLDHLDEHLSAFFGYLSRFEEAQELLRRPELMDELRRLKREHLVAMVGGSYGVDYVAQRFRIGQLYGRALLDVTLFLGAFHTLMSSIARRVLELDHPSPAEGFERMEALRKIGYLDIGVIVDAMMIDREKTIRRQQEAIRELSTPVLQVRERLLILPIIGLLDSHRAKQLTDGLLQGIRRHRAKVVVMDLTGVAMVDSKVANHLIQTVAAARLMGATVIVTGLSADVAQSLVTLGVDLSRLNTIGDLQGGIDEAERILAPLSA